jgi:Fe2+ transport system protein FeoA
MPHIPTTLDQLKPGQKAQLLTSDHPEDAMAVMRLGLIPGQVVTVQASIPGGGPLVIKQGQLEIALGRDLCQRMPVTSVVAGNATGNPDNAYTVPYNNHVSASA